MENSTNDKIKIAGAILAGAAIGAGIGMLVAPEKGYRTRKLLKRQYEDFSDDLTEKFDWFLDELKEKFESAKSDATKFTSKIKS